MSKVSFINTRTYKKHIIIAILLSIILATSVTIIGTHYVYSSGGAISDAIIEPGTQVETASYVIWKEGSTYYTKNGETGAVTSGTNATYIIQNCIGSNRKIFLKDGHFDIDVSIVISGTLANPIKNLKLCGSSRSSTEIHNTNTGGQPAIYVGGLGTDALTVADITISDLTIWGNSQSGDGIQFAKRVDYSTIEDVSVKNNGRDGLHLLDSNADECGGNLRIRNVLAYNNSRYGMYVGAGSTITIRDSSVTHSGIIGVVFQDSRAIRFVDGDIGNTTQEAFWITATERNCPSIYLKGLHFEQVAGDYVVTVNASSGRIINDVTIETSHFDGENNGIQINDLCAVYNLHILDCDLSVFDTDIAIFFGDSSRWGQVECCYFGLINPPSITVKGYYHKFIGPGFTSSGVSTVSTGDWVAHSLYDTPDTVILTPRSQVDVWVSDRNATHFQFGISAGSPTVDWYAEYRP